MAAWIESIGSRKLVELTFSTETLSCHTHNWAGSGLARAQLCVGWVLMHTFVMSK